MIVFDEAELKYLNTFEQRRWSPTLTAVLNLFPESSQILKTIWMKNILRQLHFDSSWKWHISILSVFDMNPDLSVTFTYVDVNFFNHIFLYTISCLFNTSLLVLSKSMCHFWLLERNMWLKIFILQQIEVFLFIQVLQESCQGWFTCKIND